MTSKMGVLERYVYLSEKDSALVSGGWKGFQVLIYATIFVSGMIASLSLGRATSAFGGNCYIFGNITLTNRLLHESDEIPVDNLKTEWGKEYLCNFCLYTSICGVIFSIVWTTFFLMCGKGGRTKIGIPQPWRVAWPALIFNAVFFFTSLPASINVEIGTTYFCDTFIHNNNETDCSSLMNYILFEKIPGRTAYNCFSLTQISSWIHTICWLVATLLLLIRCCVFADFELIQVTVTKYKPTRVKVQTHLQSISGSEA